MATRRIKNHLTGELVDADLVEITEIENKPIIVSLDNGSKVRVRLDVFQAARFPNSWDNEGYPLYIFGGDSTWFGAGAPTDRAASSALVDAGVALQLDALECQDSLVTAAGTGELRDWNTGSCPRRTGLGLVDPCLWAEEADFAYDNTWSYSALYGTLAETGDVLYLGLREGYRHTSYGTKEVLPGTIERVSKHFREVRMRADSGYYSNKRW